jgi:hypothetical protein
VQKETFPDLIKLYKSAYVGRTMNFKPRRETPLRHTMVKLLIANDRDKMFRRSRVNTPGQ